MPNNVRNILKIKTNDKISVQDILNRCTSFNPDDPLGKDSHFDFDKIIPEPREEKDCPEDCKVTPASHVQKEPDRPWFDWYAWHSKYWGTKWNAYDGYTIIRKSSVQFVFNTAWSAPDEIYRQLAKIFKDCNMEVKWADENFGSNCGEAVHYAGDDGWSVNYKEEEPNTRDWAKRLWNNY